MSESIFLYVDGIPGESTDQHHRGEIDVLAWRWSARSTVSVGGGGSTRGKARAGKLHIVHDYDKASPLLVKALAQGKHIAEVRLTRRRDGDGQRDFFVLTLNEVYVTRAEDSGDGDGSVEEVSFDAERIAISYTPQDHRGASGPAVTMSWNRRTTAVG